MTDKEIFTKIARRQGLSEDNIKLMLSDYTEEEPEEMVQQHNLPWFAKVSTTEDLPN